MQETKTNLEIHVSRMLSCWLGNSYWHIRGAQCQCLQCQSVHTSSLKCLIPNVGTIVKVKWSRYRPGVAQRVGRGIALLFHDHGTRRGWVVSSTPQPHSTTGKELVPILQEAGWAPGPVWTGGKSRPHRDSIPDHPAHSQSLYWLSH